METLANTVPRNADPGVDEESDGGFPITRFDPAVMAGLLARFDPSGLDDEGLLTVLAGWNVWWLPRMRRRPG